MVVRIIHEADGVLLCIAVSGRNCGTTSKTLFNTYSYVKKIDRSTLRHFVPLIMAGKKDTKADCTEWHFSRHLESTICAWRSVELRYALGHAFKRK